MAGAQADRSPIDFAALIAPVARELWGEPNKRLSRADELRWGNQGARIVYPATGAFKDTEAECAGGTLDLIQHVAQVDRAGAMAWLADHGMIDGSATSAPAPMSRSRPHAVRLAPGQRIVASFEFRLAGKLLYRKHRIEPGRGDRAKEFAFDRPSPQGGWEWGRGERVVPYRADTLGDADLIVMAEGEAKADKLAAWGYSATSLKDWHDSFGSYVRGKRVVILPDADETGAKLASRAAIMVAAADGEAITLDLPRLPPKGDVLDWDGDADELRALIAGLAFPAPETFGIANLAEWAATAPTPKSFVMAPFIPRDDVVIVTGDGGTNKSTLALQISACAAAGRQMLGMDVRESPALYITAEDDQRENHWRLAKIADALRISLHDLVGRLHVVSIRGRLNNELATFEADGTLRPTPALTLLRNTIRATGARLVTLDNVAHLYSGNENDRGQVTAFINLLYQVCGELGVTILLIAHRNKAGDSYSGSTAWLNAVRSQILLERVEGADADQRRMSLGKANYARQGEEVAFRWHDFALVRDEDLPAERMAEIASTAAASGDNALFLACLDARTRDGMIASPNVSPNYAPAQFEAMPAAKGIGRGRLRSAMERLLAIGEVEVFEHANRDKGRTVKALRRAPRTAPDAFPNGSRTTFPDAPEQSSRTTPHIHRPLKGEAGAGLEAAAPAPGAPPRMGAVSANPILKASLERVDQTECEHLYRGRDGEILAPGEQPTSGWLGK